MLNLLHLRHWFWFISILLFAGFAFAFLDSNFFAPTFIAVSWIAFLLMYQRCQKAIDEITHATKNIAEGDFNVRLSLLGVRDFDKIGRSLNQLVEDVSRTVTLLMDTSNEMERVAQGVCQVSETARQGVADQHQQVDSAATAMNEMVATVQEIANNGHQTADASQQANRLAEEGQQDVKAITDYIKSLATEVTQTRQVIEHLATDSKSIGVVVDTIRSVAEQTNLLALNAAIESARAGEHGRGFAVVADEVRSLAQRTQDATFEIQNQIENLQQRSHDGVEVMERSVALADTCVEKVEHALGKLTTIVKEVERISTMSYHIAEAAEEQTKVSEEINQNIAIVANVADVNTEKTDQTHLYSYQVLNMACEIRSTLGRFELDLDQAANLQNEEYELVTWTDALDVGMDDINLQHQRLIGLINELYRIMQLNYGLGAIKRVIQGLVSYTANHFAYEEMLFDRYGYGDSDNHKIKHRKLVEQVLSFQSRVNRGEDVADELMSFLKEWLVNHIQRSDKAYSSFLLSKGAGLRAD